MTAPWWDSALVGFDLETTGPDPETARIVTACVVADCPWQEPVSMTWLVDPGVEIPEGATAVHGISTEHAREYGERPASAVAAIINWLRVALEEGRPLVAFNAAYDFTVLDREARRYGLSPLIPDPVIDPFVLDKQGDKFRRGKRTLTACCEHYGVQLDAAHTADADALAAVHVARAIGRREPHPPASAAALHAGQIVWRRQQQESLAEYFARQGKDADVQTTWPVHPAAEPVGSLR